MNNINLKTLILRPVKNSNNSLASYAIIKPTPKRRELILSTTNLTNSISYRLAIACEDKSLILLDLNGAKKEQTIRLPENIDSKITAMLILSTNEHIFSPLLFGEYQGNKINLTEILKLYEKSIKKTKSNDTAPKSHSEDLSKSVADNHQLHDQSIEKREYVLSTTDINRTKQKIEEQKEGSLSEQEKNYSLENKKAIEYNDEAIAQENYFELYKKENDENLHNQTDLLNSCDKQEPKKEEISDSSSGYENSPCDQSSEGQFNDAKKSSEQNPNECDHLPTFYQSVKERIEQLFEKYPPFTPLNELINKGKWVKIPYSTDKFYVVGVVYENNIPSYIVYGVPGYKNQKPQGFERYSAFIPESICEIDEKGFWCILQSAETGEQIIYQN